MWQNLRPGKPKQKPQEWQPPAAAPAADRPRRARQRDVSGAYSKDENGKSLLSWRVQLLPYLEEEGELFAESSR